MTNLEIKNKIDANNETIELILNPGEFVLNNKILKLLQENAELQKQCKHNYVDGFCEYCYKEDNNK